jgi:Fe-S-cluster containining protein
VITVPNTLDKVVTAYFAALTKRSFTYKNQQFDPKPILISPLLFRGFTCPTGCGGCCHAVSLLWLPQEPQPEGLQPKAVEFDGQAYLLMEDSQDPERSKCKHLRLEDGRCLIHTIHPMPCDVELIKFISYEEKSLLVQKKYGRGWAFSRVDGGRGSMCEMTPVTDQTRADVVRKLKRIRDWTTYFHLDSWIEDIISWAESYPISEPLRLSVEGST